MVSRIFSIFSLNSYFGSLVYLDQSTLLCPRTKVEQIPVLKEMTKAFCNFLPVIVVLYLGFLTTFTMLARTSEKPLTTNEMSWLLVKVFFGRKVLLMLSTGEVTDNELQQLSRFRCRCSGRLHAMASGESQPPRL